MRITKQRTVTLTHGSVTGSLDPLPDTSVVSIQSVVQGAATFTATTDYLLTAGKVDWTPAGAEPATGSSYDVTYRYITTVVPTSVDDTGFTVAGAVVGTAVQTSYNTKLPRIDRLCLSEDGELIWVQGASTDYSPVKPSVPSNLLPLAQMVQLWTASSYVINDGLRVVPMSDIAAINARLDNVILLVSQQKLQSDAQQRDAAAKKGLFVDPFLDDSLRDAGVSQTASISNGELTLPITPSVLKPSSDVTASQTCSFTARVALSQMLYTQSMKINAYISFAPLPATAKLTPAVDRWTDVDVIWASPITSRFDAGSGTAFSETISTSIQTTQLSKKLEYLRQTVVNFELNGFGPGEVLQAVTFDGLSVTPSAP